MHQGKENINDYQKPEDTLRETQKKLKDTQLISRSGDFSLNLSTGEVIWSESIYRILGYDPNEVYDFKKLYDEIHHPEDRVRVTNWLKENMISGVKNLTPIEYRLFNKNKETIWIQAKGIIEYQGNIPFRIFGMMQDITERKEVETVLRRSEKLFRAITEQSGEGIALINQKGKTVLVNDAFSEMTGYDKETLLQMNILNLSTPNRQAAMSPKNPALREMELLRKDGNTIFAEVGGYPLRLDDETFSLGIFRDISERKRIEKELRATQMHYTNFINVSTDIVTYWKMPEGLSIDLPLETQIDLFYQATCLDCNQAFCNITTFEDKAAIVGKRISDLFPRENPTPSYLLEFFKNYRINNLEIQGPLSNGDMFYGLSSWYGVIEGGFFTYLWRTTKDISVRKKIEYQLKIQNEEYEALNEELLQSNEELRQSNEELLQTNEELSKAKKKVEKSESNLLAAQKMAKIGSYELDLNTNLWEGSQEYCRIFGFDYGKKYTTQDFYDLIHPDDVKAVINHFEDCIAHHKEINFEYRVFQRKSKKLIYIKSNSKVYYDREGKALKIIGARQDISELKKIQLELEQHKNNLEHLVRKRTDELESSNEELAQLNEELYSANEQLTLQTQELENTLSQLKNTQAQLLQSEKMASLGVLVAGIAHEINNPINFINSNAIGLKQNLPVLQEVIRLYGQLTKENFDQVAQQIKEVEGGIPTAELMPMFAEALDHIVVGVERTTKIVKGLRTFTRADEEKLSYYDVYENIENTLLILHNQYKNRIQIVREFGIIPLIQGYPGLINQVFMNLLANAIQAIKGEGTITIRAEVSGVGGQGSGVGGQGSETSTSSDPSLLSPDPSLPSPDSQILISIKDSGCGIPSENLTRIFDPFFTTKKVGEGTGLGLSIVYNNIRKHNGKILVNSQLNQGTEFSIYLPVKQEKN